MQLTTAEVKSTRYADGTTLASYRLAGQTFDFYQIETVRTLAALQGYTHVRFIYPDGFSFIRPV